MRTASKRLLCLIVSVCVCCTAFSQMFVWAANDTEPMLSSRCETVIDIDGKNGSFGNVASDLRTSTSIKFASSINLSASDIFELDVYIENITALKSTITDTQCVQFGFSSNSRRATSNYAVADISPQLIRSGWNSICVNRSDFVESGINWSSIHFVFIRFADEAQSLPSALLGTEVKTRNICESYSAPEMSDGDVVLYDSYKISSLGETADSPVSYIGDTFNISINATDLTDVAFLKVDLLCSDLAALKSFIADKELRFVLSSINGSAYYVFSGAYFAGTLADWYTIRLPLNDFIKDKWFDITKVTGVKAEIAGGDSGERIGDYYSLKFGFANIRGIKILSQQYDGAYGKVKDDYAIKQKVISFDRRYSDFSYNLSAEYPALADADNIEFDLYVDNYDSFKNLFVYDSVNTPINASLDLKLSKGTKTVIWSGIEKKVISSGWNHIILPVPDAVNSGFNVNASFSDMSIEITGVDGNLENPAYGGFIIIDRLISTKGEAASNILRFEECAVISEGKSILVGSTYKASEIAEELTTAADLTNAKFIECDIYVQNFERFKAISAQNGVSDISMMLSSASGTAADRITGSIKHDGWNHIEIPVSAFINGEVSGAFDIAGVSSWKLFYKGIDTAATGVLQNQRIAIRNITAGVVNDPQLPEDAAVIISENGKTGVYGDSYSAIEGSSIISLSEPIDLSENGQISFDYYVEDFDKFSLIINGNPLYFAIGTNADKTKGVALFEFTRQVKGIGWNHITLYTLNCKNFGDSTVDFSSAYHIYLTFSSATGTVAYGSSIYRFKNITARRPEYETLPQMPVSAVATVIDDSFVAKYGENIPLTFSTKSGYGVKRVLSAAVDLSAADHIEFDIYVSDVELLQAYDSLYLSLYPAGNANGGYRADFSFADLLQNEGWNHICINKTTARSRGATGSYPYSIDWTNIGAVELMTYGTGAPNVKGTGFAIIANICGTLVDGFCHSLDFGPYTVDFDNGALIGGQAYANGDVLNDAGVYDLSYTEDDVNHFNRLTLYRLGDVNCDNDVNIFDYVRLKKGLTGTSKLNAAGEKASDFSLDGDISPEDLSLFRKSILFGKNFPISGYTAKDMEKLVDFTVEIESGRDIRVLQLTDTQIIESEQRRTEGRIGNDLYRRWLSTKKDKMYHDCVRQVIENYNPDLIIVTGDLVYGEFDDNGGALLEFIEFMDSFNIPWAPVFGNHENESYKGVDWQCAQLVQSEHCLFKQRNLTGNGNYTVGLKQDGVYKRVFFMLDSNGCSAMSDESRANGHSKTTAGFGEDQIKWYTSLSQKIRYAQPGVKLSAAFHIQLNVFAKAFARYGYDSTVKAADFVPIDIDTRDDRLVTDFGFVGKKLKGPWDGDESVWYSFKNSGFDSIYVGHEHSNSASIVYKGVRLQYGQKSSTYDRANYIKADGSLDIGNYTPASTSTPIIGGTSIPIKQDGSLGIGTLLLYNDD